MSALRVQLEQAVSACASAEHRLQGAESDIRRLRRCEHELSTMEAKCKALQLELHKKTEAFERLLKRRGGANGGYGSRAPTPPPGAIARAPTVAAPTLVSSAELACTDPSPVEPSMASLETAPPQTEALVVDGTVLPSPVVAPEACTDEPATEGHIDLEHADAGHTAGNDGLQIEIDRKIIKNRTAMFNGHVDDLKN